MREVNSLFVVNSRSQKYLSHHSVQCISEKYLCNSDSILTLIRINYLYFELNMENKKPNLLDLTVTSIGGIYSVGPKIIQRSPGER